MKYLKLEFNDRALAFFEDDVPMEQMIEWVGNQIGEDSNPLHLNEAYSCDVSSNGFDTIYVNGDEDAKQIDIIDIVPIKSL